MSFRTMNDPDQQEIGGESVVSREFWTRTSEWHAANLARLSPNLIVREFLRSTDAKLFGNSAAGLVL